jgi:hypothetical protein
MKGCDRTAGGMEVKSMDVSKHLLTIFHCVMAAVIASLGLSLAAGMAREHPVQSRLVGLAVIIVPVLIATRVSWRVGYEAGRRAKTQDSRSPDPLRHLPESKIVITDIQRFRRRHRR